MSAWTAVLLVVAVTGFNVYVLHTKPECRDGFTPLYGFSVGWYCAPGYKP